MMCNRPYKFLFALVFSASINTALCDTSKMRQGELDSLLTHDCGSCHGLKRNGGLGPALHAKDMQKYSLEALVAVILEGIPNSAMPPWGELLSKDDARYLAEELLVPKLISPD